MKNAFSFEKRKDGIGILYFDVPGESVNKFSTAVMEELEQKADSLQNEDIKCLLIMNGKKPGFYRWRRYQ